MNFKNQHLFDNIKTSLSDTSKDGIFIDNKPKKHAKVEQQKTNEVKTHSKSLKLDMKSKANHKNNKRPERQEEIAEGILDPINNKYGFLRMKECKYKPCKHDVYVPSSILEKHDVRRGDLIKGHCRKAELKERFRTLTTIDTINDVLYEKAESRKHFGDLLPIYPDFRYVLEHSPVEYNTRFIDLFAPIGKGQRGLIVSQPKSGKTTLLRHIACGINTNYPNTKVLILLIDERPEEVTEMQRFVKHERIYASTFDEIPENHIYLAELVFERSKRLTEQGYDVVLLIDSITRLCRSYNLCMSSRGRTMSGGIDAEALKMPRQLFSAARNIENGGSLTVLATALVKTGSRMDDVIFEEFKGTGNMEIILNRDLANMRIFPAIDILNSGTRKVELLVSPEEQERVHLLYQVLNQMDTTAATSFMLDKIKGTQTNKDFLMQMQS